MARGFARLGHVQRAPVRGLVALVLLFLMLVSFSPSATAFPSNVDVDMEVAGPGAGPVIVADLDGDGWNDILCVDEQGNIAVHFQDPLDQDFPFDDTVSVDSSVALGMAVGLLDSDEMLDIASFTHDTLVLNFQHPARAFEKNEIQLPFLPNSIGIGDLNGDLGEDIVLLGDQEILVLYRNSALPEFYGMSDIYWDMTGGDGLVLGHFGGSKGLDIAVSTPWELHIFVQEPQGLEHNRTIALEGNFTSSSVGVGHFDSDSLDDIVVLRSGGGDDNRIDIYAQNLEMEFSLFQTIEDEHFGEDFSVGDLNDDGRSDIAVVADEGESGAMLYLQREGTRSEFSLFSIGNASAPGGRIALGDLNWDPYTDIVLRTTDRLQIFFQDDFPPYANQIPSRTFFNENTVADNLIKLDDYIKDDHTTLQYAVIYESDPDLLHAMVDGVYLDFYPKEDWVGLAKFQVVGWQGDYIVHSNKFIVGVNDVPDVISNPVTRAEVGEEYVYRIIAEDTFPSDDRLKFNLVWGPKGMEINPFTGTLTWTPERNGEYKVAVFVEDQYGGRVEHSFVIEVGQKNEFPFGIVVGGAAGLITIIVLFAAFLLWNENALFSLLLLLVPLYTKLRREKILDHFVRGKIYGYILANPGEHYNAIREALDLTNGSLAHHLRTLEREGFIKSKKFGVFRRFYPMKMKIPDDSVMVNEIQKTIMAIIKKHPGISQKEIASDINLTPPTVNYHIGILSRLGLIHVTRRGRRTECYLDI